MEERDLTAEPVPSKADYGSEQLIYSQSNWAGEALVYQWLRKMVVRKNLF
jgi:hypothetical protein